MGNYATILYKKLDYQYSLAPRVRGFEIRSKKGKKRIPFQDVLVWFSAEQLDKHEKVMLRREK